MATAAELKARLSKYVSKQSAEPTVTQLVAATVVPVLPTVQTPAPNQQLTVTTDVQSTDVVVLERPTDIRRNESTVGATGLADDVSNSVDSQVSTTNLDQSNPIHADFLQRLSDLERALLDRDPLMKTHLGAIHKAMIQYEEIANLLTVEEISKIMTAQQAHTGIVLRAETVNKSKAAATKKANQLSIHDV